MTHLRQKNNFSRNTLVHCCNAPHRCYHVLYIYTYIYIYIARRVNNGNEFRVACRCHHLVRPTLDTLY
jgi:hypothetical protein